MKRYPFYLAFLFSACSLFGQPLPSIDHMVTEKGAPDDFSLVEDGSVADVLVDAKDNKTVVLVTGLFSDDVQRVTGLRPEVKNDAGSVSRYCVIAGTIEESRFIKELVAKHKIDVSGMKGQWESCLIQVVDKPFKGIDRALVVAGSDRRGTSYGLLEISKQIGVSPWYYFADVPVRKHDQLIIKSGRFLMKSPSVQYRGIFINDEMWGIRPWAENTLAPREGEGLGPTTYGKIFELLLRLKANLLWPAMHLDTKPFNSYENNKLVADSFAIVMGSSHIEPMLRNNMRHAEWDAEYPGEPFNYVTNRDHIYKYWEKRAKENGSFENMYTLGKRGQDDEPGKEITVPVLEQVISDQREILQEWVNKDVTKVPQVVRLLCPLIRITAVGSPLPLIMKHLRSLASSPATGMSWPT